MRLPISLFCGLAAFAGAMFDSHGASAATGRTSVDVAGQKRSVLLIEFERLKRSPRTAIIVLRGGGASARNALTDRRGIGLSPVVRSAGVVIAYPDAVDGRWNLGAGGVDDVAFVRALAAKLVADGVAHPRRIFIAGESSGGILAMRIACEGADFIAGLAVMISAMPSAMAPSCKIAKPTALLMINGTADPLVPYQGGTANLGAFKENVLSVEETLKPFLAAAQCNGERTKHDAPDRDPNDGSRVVVENFAGCKTPVELVRVEGGGHTLPGRPARADRGVAVGALNNDISTPRVISDFVRRVAR